MRKTMEDYIQETSLVLAENIKNRKELTGPLIEWLKKNGAGTGKTIVIIASGSSYNAADSAVLFMKQYVENEIRVVTPFTFCYYEEITDANIYIFVSQSGSSTNVIEAISKYRETGREVTAILGNRDTDIGRMADCSVEYGVGEEKVGYVTKGMSTLTCFFMLTALELAFSYTQKDVYEQGVEDIRKAAEKHRLVYSRAKDFCRTRKKDLLSMKNVMFMGCGSNYGTALEGALKLSEMVHIQSSVYEIEEFIHGPNLQLTPEYTLFFIDGGDEAGKRVKEIYYGSKEVTDKAFLISAGEYTDNRKEAVTPLYLTAFFQYLAYWTAKELNITSEHPLLEKFEEKIKCKTEEYEEVEPF